jgi:hypothetical protein
LRVFFLSETSDTMKKLHSFSKIALVAGAFAGALQAQGDSRLAEIAAQQEQKAAETRPEQQGRVERGLIWFRDAAVLERFADGIGGVRLKLGGLAPGSGLAAGPEYHRDSLSGGLLTLRTGAQTSTRGYRKLDFELGAPRLAGGRLFALIYGVHHNYPGMSYYGPGPDSEKTGRSNFRLEDTAIDATFGVRPTRRLTVGSSAGYLFNNIGAGTDSRYATSVATYSPVQARGIDVQSNFMRTGTFVQYDWRDDPGGPRSGGNYFAQFSDYRDRSFGVSHFRRLDIEAQQYFSILNERRVFATRVRSTLTFRDDNRFIPFYMQPSLGGSEDLRGYRPFRFRDDNLLVMNAEYRWEVFSGLDMALFADAGKVFSRRSQFNLTNLESNAGFGFRFNARNQTFLRLDVAFSHEGFQVWVKFNNVFRKGPVHTSSSMGDF